jgi:putative transposase
LLFDISIVAKHSIYHGVTPLPGSTIIDLPCSEQEQLLFELRRARYSYWRALHIILLCAAGYTPTQIAAVLFCSRASVYRTVKAYRAGALVGLVDADQPHRAGSLTPSVRRSLLALLKRVPSAYGWCRTRWSCATLAAQMQVQRRVQVSAATLRRWLHQLGWVWKRAKLVARDDDPERISKLARIRFCFENLSRHTALLVADELDIHLLPKVGYQWMPKGEVVEVVTPGVNQKRYLAGALDALTGKVISCIGERQTRWLFLELLKALDASYAAATYKRVVVVVDNFGIHKAKVIQQGLAAHPRIELLFLPVYCPKANPIERVFWEVHDKCTRHQRRKQIRQLVGDVEQHLEVNGPWPYKLSAIYYTAEVTAAVKELEKQPLLQAA